MSPFSSRSICWSRRGERRLLSRRGHELWRRSLSRGQRLRERVASGKHGRQGEGRRRSLFGGARQAPKDGRLRRRAQLSHRRRRGRDAPVLVDGDDLRQRLGLESTPSGEQLVEDEAHREQLAPDRDLLGAELLGGHVGGRSGAGVRVIVGQAREPEVGDSDLPVLVDQDIGGLEVAMEDVLVVRGAEPGAELARDLEPALLRKASHAPEQRRQVLAADVLHREERPPVHLADVVDAANVRVRDPSRDPELFVEQREPMRIRRELFGKELERDLLLQCEVLHAVDLAHAALADHADHAIATGEDVSRLEVGAARGRGRRGRAARAERLVLPFINSDSIVDQLLSCVMTNFAPNVDRSKTVFDSLAPEPKRFRHVPGAKTVPVNLGGS